MDKIPSMRFLVAAISAVGAIFCKAQTSHPQLKSLLPLSWLSYFRTIIASLLFHYRSVDIHMNPLTSPFFADTILFG
jgi:hypothetical protein